MLIEELQTPQITPARVQPVQHQIEREFGWQPTPALRDQLYDAADGPQITARCRAGRTHITAPRPLLHADDLSQRLHHSFARVRLGQKSHS